jgi:leader peptidase (prepilin peptidase)/N-methyltransferase
VSSQISQALGAALAGVLCLAAAPYLAGLTLSVPDAADRRWWRFRRTSAARTGGTALAAGAFGALAGWAAGWGAAWPAYLALALCCAPLAVIDLECHRLPNRLMLPACVAAAALLTIAAAVRGDWRQLLRAVEAAAATFAVLFLLAFAAPRSFGFGDVKLGALLGGYLGWVSWGHAYYGIFGGFVLGAVVALALLATGRAGLKTAMAFGPMLILGALLVLALDLVPDLTP